MNPRTPVGQAPEAAWRNEGRIDWEQFKTWLFKEFLPVTAKEYFLYAKKYADCLVIQDVSKLKLLTNSQRTHALRGLSALSKFLGVYEGFRNLVRNYGLKWKRKDSSELIIERLTKTPNSNEIFEWIRRVKKALPQLNEFMNFIVSTGLRYNEAIESYNLIIKLANEGKLNQYYNNERDILEHFKFKEIFIRRTKKCFISFVSKKLVRQISHNQYLRWNPTKKKVSRKVGCLRFADIRELHSSFMTKYLRHPEIDFLQGRVSGSVFMRNYFNPTLIGDLRERVFKGIEELLRLLGNNR